jgi:hypothetical protein
VPPDFLNSREDAIVLWSVAILGFVLYKDFVGISRSLVAVLRALLQPKLLLLFGSALAYSAAIVYVAHELELWHAPALKVTIYWFIGTAVVLAGNAVSEGSRDRRAYLRKVLGRVLAVTILIEFVVGIYALPLAVEIVCVGLLFLFTGMQVVAQHDATTSATTRKFIDRVLIAVGLLYLSYFAIRLVTDVDGFLTRKNLEDFLVPPLLTVTLVPFLLGAAWISRREQESLRARDKAPLPAALSRGGG